MPNLQPSRWWRALQHLTVVFSVLAACKARRLPEELPAAQSHRAAEQNGAGEQLGSAEAGSSSRLGPAPGAPGERPSLDQNMGRGFQGTLALRVRQADGVTEDLRYLSLGNTARLQLDAPDGQRRAVHLDALIWGESISLLDHQQRSVRTFQLRQIRPDAEPASEITTHETGERSSIQGVFCEHYSMQQGPLHIDACVSGLPGSFDVDKLEAVSGIDVPAWAERLLEDDLLPLQARVRDASGRQLYALELLQYAPGPVDPELLQLPENYRRLAAQDPAASALTRAPSALK